MSRCESFEHKKALNFRGIISEKCGFSLTHGDDLTAKPYGVSSTYVSKYALVTARHFAVLHPIFDFGTLGVIKAIHGTNKIAGNPPDTFKVNTFANQFSFVLSLIHSEFLWGLS